MNKRTVIFTAVLVLICFLLLGYALYLGGALIVFYTYDGGVMDLTYNVVIALIGVSLIFAVIPQLIASIVGVHRKHMGKADLLFCLRDVLAGMFLACLGIGTLIVYSSGYDMIDSCIEDLRASGTAVDSDVGNMIHEGFEQMLRWPRMGVVPIALYLIIVPLIRTFRSEDRKLRYRVELYKPVLGTLALFMTVFAAVMWHMEDDPVGITVKVIGCLMGALAALYLIAALAGLSKALTATNAPAGVSTEDYTGEMTGGVR